MPAPDPTLAALYKAVLAAPDDDLPRLVYADRLDELGQHERAEFIRLQIHLANTSPWDDGHADADVRSRILLARHWEAWGGEDLIRELARARDITPKVSRAFVRGFPEVAWVDIDKFSAAHRKALKKYPIRELVLSGGRSHRAVELINEVRPLAVNFLHAGSRVYHDLSEGLPLPSVRRMKFDGDTGYPCIDDVREMAGRGPYAFPKVEAVEVSGLDERSMADFLRRLRWPKLTDVALTGLFNAEVIEALAGAKWLANVRRLSLAHVLYGDPNDLTPLLRSTYLGGLRELDLDGLPLPPDAVREFAESSLGPLDHFRLVAGSPLSVADHHTLLSVPALAGVKSLVLATLGENAADVADLIGRNGELRQLECGGRDFPAEAVAALANSPAAQSLRRWDTHWMSLDEPTVTALTAKPWPCLAELVCKYGKHDGRAVAKFIDHPHFARLTHLDATRTSAADNTSGIRAGDLWRKLAKSKTVGRFHKLRLGFDIDDKQLNAVLDNPEVAKIGHLALPQRVKVAAKTQRRYEKVFGVRITRDY